MLSIRNELQVRLQMELQKFVTYDICFGLKSNNTTTTKTKIKYNNPCQSRELNPGPLAP